MIGEGTVLFASDTSAESVAEAREWIRGKGLTQVDVKLIQKDGMTLIVAKRRVEV